VHKMRGLIGRTVGVALLFALALLAWSESR
jgi:hypothetical protein